jgi:hypothetical protein
VAQEGRNIKCNVNVEVKLVYAGKYSHPRISTRIYIRLMLVCVSYLHLFFSFMNSQRLTT